MPNPWVILGVVVAWALSVVGAGYWEYTEGKATANVQWEKVEAQENAQAAAKILQLENQARDAEAKHEAEMTVTVGQLTKDHQDEIATYQSTIDKLRSGALKLRDPGTLPTCSCSTSKTPANPAGNPTGTTGQLSEQLAEFLTSEASRADQVTAQLAACQKALQDDRN